MNSLTASNGVSHVAKTTPILTQVNQEVHPDTEDRAFWWDALSKPLALLLQENQYSDEVQLHYLRWFYKIIPPALGPRPVNGRPFYGSWLTHDLSPFEFSINWKEKSPKQTIRFTIEPVTKKAGTAADPINQLGAKEFLESVLDEVPGLELTRFNQFLEATNVPDDSFEDAIAKHPSNFPRSRVCVAFDLEHSGKMMPKAYYLPHWVAIQSGIPANTIISNAVRASTNGADGSSYDGSMAAINSYVASFANPEDAPQIVMLSNDLVADAPGMRLKVYFPFQADTLAKAKDLYTLGGRLKGSIIDASLKRISEFWYHLFGLDSSDPASDDKVLIRGHPCFFVYEMRSSQGSEPDIDVKFHIPMWQIGKTDAQISDRLASWFEIHGHPDLAARYKSDLETVFPKRNMEKTTGTHTFLSITYTPKTGLYMTMYLSPKLPEFHF